MVKLYAQKGMLLAVQPLTHAPSISEHQKRHHRTPWVGSRGRHLTYAERSRIRGYCSTDPTEASPTCLNVLQRIMVAIHALEGPAPHDVWAEGTAQAALAHDAALELPIEHTSPLSPPSPAAAVPRRPRSTIRRNYNHCLSPAAALAGQRMTPLPWARQRMSPLPWADFSHHFFLCSRFGGLPNPHYIH